MSAKELKSKNSQLEIRKVRVFSESFKKKRVEDLENKVMTIKEIVELYGVSRTAVYKWLYLYSPHHQQRSRMVIENISEAEKTKQLLQRVLELEAMIGRKQMELDYYSKLFEVAEESLGYNLKKTLEQKLSNGSEKTIKNMSTK